MYEYIPYFLGIGMLGMGLFMLINPKMATKQEFRNDSKTVNKTRKSGCILVVSSIIVIIVGMI